MLSVAHAPPPTHGHGFIASEWRFPRGATEIAFRSCLASFVLIAFMTIVEPSRIVRTSKWVDETRVLSLNNKAKGMNEKGKGESEGLRASNHTCKTSPNVSTPDREESHIHTTTTTHTST